MQQFLMKFSLLSLVIQVVTELVQRAGLSKFTQAIAVIVGVIVAVTTQTGLLAQFGVAVHPLLADWAFMGFALAGGGWVVDLVKKLGAAQLPQGLQK